MGADFLDGRGWTVAGILSVQELVEEHHIALQGGWDDAVHPSHAFGLPGEGETGRVADVVFFNVLYQRDHIITPTLVEICGIM